MVSNVTTEESESRFGQGYGRHFFSPYNHENGGVGVMMEALVTKAIHRSLPSATRTSVKILNPAHCYMSSVQDFLYFLLPRLISNVPRRVTFDCVISIMYISGGTVIIKQKLPTKSSQTMIPPVQPVTTIN